MTINNLETKITIVLVGNFNPLIFKPGWFAKNGVIGEEEAESADIDVIHNELVKFQLTWLSILVEKNRFVMELKQPPEVRLYDFALKTFGELLLHTPIWAMGINTRVEFDAGSIEQRNKLGYTLAPLDAWGAWASDLEKSNKGNAGGMSSIIMRQAVADSRPKGYIQAKVEPLSRIDSGVAVEVNDHYSIEDIENVEGCTEIINMLRNNFEESISKSHWIVEQVQGAIS